MIVNLLENAYYAVVERQRQVEAGFAPQISISSRVSPELRDKIFDPFFTTKSSRGASGSR